MLGTIVFVAFVSATTSDKWDDAVAIKVCDKFPILQRKDGTIWLRVDGYKLYRVENVDKLC